MAILSAPQIAKVCYDAGFRGTDLVIAVAVALAESAGKTDATNRNTNGSTDFGLFQINSIHSDLLSQGNWRDPNANARMAYTLYKRRGNNFKDWVTFNSGSYKKFLNSARLGAGNPSTNIPDTPTTQDVAAASAGPFQPLIDFFGFITDVENWKRLAYFVVGGILLVIALFRISGASKAIKPIAKTAVKAAVLA